VEVVEGPLATAFVADTPDKTIIGSGNVCLAVANKNMPSTQAIQGYIPALFHPRDDGPKTILGIALGSGQSFGALLRYPIERMDVVDISSEIIDLSLRRFAPFNHGLGSDPRVRFFLDDGRHFVERASDESYDVVSMEPPPPTAEGIFSLYSLGFYEEARRILREHGVLMQWLPLYRITPNDLRGIIKTQANVFPNTFVMKVGQGDFMIVSFKSAAPPVFDTERIEARARVFEGERLIEGARWEPSCRYEIASLNGVLSLILTGPDQIREMEAPVIYRDDDERLSYTSGDRLLLWRFVGGMTARLAFTALPLTPFEELQKYFRQPIPVKELDDERARSLRVFEVPLAGDVAAQEERFERAEAPSERFEAALEMAAIWARNLAKDEALAWLTAALESQPERPVRQQIQAVRTIVRRGLSFYHGRTRAWFESLPEELRDSKLGQVASTELRGYETREERRRRAYLWN
jgi:spermidine synthase